MNYIKIIDGDCLVRILSTAHELTNGDIARIKKYLDILKENTSRWDFDDAIETLKMLCKKELGIDFEDVFIDYEIEI